MNNPRRKNLRKLIDRLEDLKSEIESIQEEEQEALDNIPENLWGSERYETSENAVESMGSAVDVLCEVLDYLEDAIE